MGDLTQGQVNKSKTSRPSPPPSLSHFFTPSDPTLLLIQPVWGPINKLSLRGTFLALSSSFSLPNFCSFFMVQLTCDVLPVHSLPTRPLPAGRLPPTVHLLPATPLILLCPELCAILLGVFASCHSKVGVSLMVQW